MADIATYQIGIVGPTRVGKTSLVSTLLQDGQQALTGTSVSLKAESGPTSRRLFQHRNEMRASVDAREFSGSLGGTTDAFTFRLVLDGGDPDSVLRFDILDYPGGWLESGGQGWETVQDFLTDSSVMLVPVDATVLVEAVTRDQKYTSLNLLAVQHVHQLVVEWSKRRNEQPEEPAMLMLIPVKCESYLVDSGALRDRSNELRE